jgi:alpha-amylase
VSPLQHTTPAGDADTLLLLNSLVHEFGAAHNLRDHFDRSNGKEIQWLVKSNFGQSWGLVESQFANVFIANHDTERESTPTTLNSRSANNAYVLASIFMLGWNYGVPTVLSGYDFDGDFDKGAPQASATGLTNQVECFKNGFRCEHRWQAISNMVYLRKVAGKEPVSNTATGNAHQIGKATLRCFSGEHPADELS